MAAGRRDWGDTGRWVRRPERKGTQPWGADTHTQTQKPVGRSPRRPVPTAPCCFLCPGDGKAEGPTRSRLPVTAPVSMPGRSLQRHSSAFCPRAGGRAGPLPSPDGVRAPSLPARWPRVPAELSIPRSSPQVATQQPSHTHTHEYARSSRTQRGPELDGVTIAYNSLCFGTGGGRGPGKPQLLPKPHSQASVSSSVKWEAMCHPARAPGRPRGAVCLGP